MFYFRTITRTLHIRKVLLPITFLMFWLPQSSFALRQIDLTGYLNAGDRIFAYAVFSYDEFVDFCLLSPDGDIDIYVYDYDIGYIYGMMPSDWVVRGISTAMYECISLPCSTGWYYVYLVAYESSEYSLLITASDCYISTGGSSANVGGGSGGCFIGALE